MTRSSKRQGSDFLSIRPCGRSLFELIPRRKMSIDLGAASSALKKAGFQILEVSEMAITAKGNCDISLFPNGKMLVHPFDSNESAEEAGMSILSLLKTD